ncbi:MAG: PPC domain-containing protein, partial [Pseudomonadota bacterium]
MTTSLALACSACWEGGVPPNTVLMTCGLSDDEARCDDSNACTLDDRCWAGTCHGQPATYAAACDDGNPCTELDACAGEVCRGVLAPNDMPCDDLDPCTVGDICAWGVCGGNAKDCSSVADTCHTGACAPATGACEPVALADETECDDGNRCTHDDACSAGQCAGLATDCAAWNDGCNTGVCDAESGACTKVAVADGSACQDDSACTGEDTCTGGECQPGRLLDCADLTGGCMKGPCNPVDGTCAGAPIADASPCDDGDPCTGGDACLAGACTATKNLCQCDGVADGTGCDDYDACTVADACAGELCKGKAVDCSGLDNACNYGVCDPATGGCLPNPVFPGTPCDDLDPCTVADACASGGVVCQGTAKDCHALDSECLAGVCEPGTGVCTTEPRADGTACADSDPCTGFETCTAGECGGGLDICGPCHDGSAGSPCDDSNPCTGNDVCFDDGSGGLSCRGELVACTDLDSACHEGFCDPSTGACAARPRGGKAVCDDANNCTERDVCDKGTCAGIQYPVCGTTPSRCESHLPNDSVETAEALGRLASPVVVVRMRVDAPGESDWLAVALVAGELLTVNTLADCDETIDTILAVYDRDGTTVLAHADDVAGSSWARIESLAAPADGVYFVRAFSYQTGS